MNETGKLKHLLDHWIEHNVSHINTYTEWAEKADALGQNELSGIIRQIADESRKLDGLFKKALGALQVKR